MRLTDVAIRAVKPGSKPFKLSDERGLFLLPAERKRLDAIEASIAKANTFTAVAEEYIEKTER